MEAYSSTDVNLHYCSDVLLHFAQAGTDGAHTNKLTIGRELREKLVNWAFDACYELNASGVTGQLAVVLFDEFISRTAVSNTAVLRLVIAVALMLAFKVSETSYLNPRDISEMCEKTYTAGDVITTERFMLQTLSWNLLRPTAAETLPYLLVLTQDYNALECLLGRCEAYASLCYADHKLSGLSANTIAAASLCCVLSKLNRMHTGKGAAVLNMLPKSMQAIFETQTKFDGFKSSWLSQLEDNAMLKASQVVDCQVKLEKRLSILMSPSTACTDS